MNKGTVTVSDTTLQFLELRNALSEYVYAPLQELMIDIYGYDQGNEIAEGEVLDKVEELGDVIDKYMCRHIEMKWGNGTRSTEI